MELVVLSGSSQALYNLAVLLENILVNEWPNNY